MIQSLISIKKRIWNFTVEAKDLDNRVGAQSGTVSIPLLLSSGIESSILD